MAVGLSHRVRNASSGSEAFRLSIGGGALAAGKARREISRLRADLDPPLLESVRLLVTELVTNSVRHADVGAMELTVLVGNKRVRVEIANPGSPFEPRSRDDSARSDTGWGLFLVDRLSDAWGVDDDERGRQRVWFEVLRTH